MPGLIRCDEGRECLQPAVSIELETERVVHPGADAVDMSSRNSVLHRIDQVRIHRRRQPLFAAHTFMLTHYYESATPVGLSGWDDA